MANYFSNRYPYTDFHELNLDWIIDRMRKLEINMDEFKVVNNITFSGQWDITKQYPAWTIVSDNNIGYVSQKPVPVGVPLTNGNYWVEVIDYTAQIAGLEQRVITLENEDITINGKITTINNNLTRLNRGFDRIQGKTIGFYCDSWGASYPQWIYRIWNNIGGQGAGFNKSYGGYSMESLYNNIIAGDSDTADIYVICAGVNDYNSQKSPQNTRTYARAIINSLLTKSPNAEIYFILPPTTIIRDAPGIPMYFCVDWYRNIINNAVTTNPNNYNCSVLDCDYINGFKIRADGLHPDDSCLNRMGDCLSQFINDFGTGIRHTTGTLYDMALGRAFYDPSKHTITLIPANVSIASGHITINNSKFNSTDIDSLVPAIFHVPYSSALHPGYIRPVATGLDGEIMGSTYTGNPTTYDTTQMEFRCKP